MADRGHRQPRYMVSARLTCGHAVEVKDLTKARAEQVLDVLRTSGFCSTCWKWSPTKAAHVQPPLF